MRYELQIRFLIKHIDLLKHHFYSKILKFLLKDRADLRVVQTKAILFLKPTSEKVVSDMKRLGNLISGPTKTD